MTTHRRRLHDRVQEALIALASRVLPNHPQRRDEFAEWLETAHEGLLSRRGWQIPSRPDRLHLQAVSGRRQRR
jgi:hypothetical protein